MLAVNAAHAFEENVRIGPFGSLLSLTSTRPGRLLATSTQAPPLALLRLDLRHLGSVMTHSPSS